MVLQCVEGNHTLRTQIACWWTELADRSFGFKQAYQDCETASRHAIAMFEQVAETFPEQAIYRMQLRQQYDRLIRLFRDTDRPEDVRQAERQRTAVFQDVVDGFPATCWNAHTSPINRSPEAFNLNRRTSSGGRKLFQALALVADGHY